MANINDIINSKKENYNYIENMKNETTEIFQIIKITNFDENEFCLRLKEYIIKYDRIMHSQITTDFYGAFDINGENGIEVIINNVNKLKDFIFTKEFALNDYKLTECDINNKKIKMIIIKMIDHIELANRQCSYLKQTDKQYKEKFELLISPIEKDVKKDLEEKIKDINSQLLNMVGIFTALSFLIFGGISSLDNIFQNSSDLSLLKIIFTGSLWGLCIINMIFIFLFLVGKMTKLSISSTENKDASIFQKYPIIWWSNLVIISIMILSGWFYYLAKNKMLLWLLNLTDAEYIIISISGTLILIIFILVISHHLIKNIKNSS